MLDDAIAAYLAALDEREFDAPFLALLRAEGFVDIHHLHGSFEFGKDVIAKRLEDGALVQYAFQLKAGDLNQSAWNAARPQLDQLRYNTIAHPDFDPSLPRKPILATTGDLVGGAAADAQQYRRYLVDRGEVPFDVWTRQRFVDAFTRSPELGLAGWLDGPLLGVLSRIDAEDIGDADIELFSRRWLDGSFERAAVAASLIAHQLAQRMRRDLSCFTALCLLRAALHRQQARLATDDHVTAPSGALIPFASRLFGYHARVLWEGCGAAHLDPEAVYAICGGPMGAVTYPVWCLRLVEMLSLYGLYLLDAEEPEADDVAAFVAAFVAQQPGAAQPVSDRWAASLVAAAAMLKRTGRQDVATSWLERVAVWIADRHDGSIGLAGPRADPATEVRQLLGGPYEHVDLRPRRLSLVASMTLDLCCVLELGQLFPDALNDFLAVDIAFPVVEPRDEPGQFLVSAESISFEANARYDEEANLGADWRAGVHHRRAPEAMHLVDEGFAWQVLAMTSVLRDRLFFAALRAVAR